MLFLYTVSLFTNFLGCEECYIETFFFENMKLYFGNFQLPTNWLFLYIVNLFTKFNISSNIYYMYWWCFILFVLSIVYIWCLYMFLDMTSLMLVVLLCCKYYKDFVNVLWLYCWYIIYIMMMIYTSISLKLYLKFVVSYFICKYFFRQVILT